MVGPYFNFTFNELLLVILLYLSLLPSPSPPLPPSLLLPLPLPLPPPTLPPSLPPSLSYPLPLLSSLPPSLSPDLSSVACSCLLSLVVALGDTGKMLAALSALLTSPPPLSDHSLLVCTPHTSSAVFKYTYILVYSCSTYFEGYSLGDMGCGVLAPFYVGELLPP